MYIQKILVIVIVLLGIQLIGASNMESPQFYDQSQGALIDKILEYLPYDAKKNIDTKGMCNGLSSLWAYGMYLSDQPNPEGKDRDDHHFFKTAQQLLLTKTVSEYALAERSIVDRFIQHIIFFQDWIKEERTKRWLEDHHSDIQLPKQLELDQTLEDTRGRKAVELMDVKLVCTKEILQKRLNRLTRVPGNMVFTQYKELGELTLQPYTRARNQEKSFIMIPIILKEQ